jgi:hypothetical protein
MIIRGILVEFMQKSIMSSDMKETLGILIDFNLL